MKTYASDGQDRFVAETLFGGKRNGVFAEIGAFDGETLSNTALLEREFGWRGICVEPIPSAFERLRANRACVLVEAAAAAEEGRLKLEILDHPSAMMLSGRSDRFDPAHERRLARTEAKHGLTRREIEVQARPMAAVFREHRLTELDYVSVDVEGGELECLKGMLAPDITIRVISVENNYGNPEVDAYLRQHGFLRFARLGVDDFYKPAREATAAERGASRTLALRSQGRYWSRRARNGLRRVFGRFTSR
ncbi:MAG: FkbM family methyltransferase [Hyphomicrobiaceae bacterium]